MNGNIVKELEAVQQVLKLLLEQVNTIKIQAGLNASKGSGPTYKGCWHCFNSNRKYQPMEVTCKLVNCVPPKDIIENGCEKFDLDDIPF